MKYHGNKRKRRGEKVSQEMANVGRLDGGRKREEKKRSERRTRSKKLLNRQVEQIQLGSGPKFDRSLIVVRRDPVCLGIPSGHLHAPLTYGSTHTLHVLGGQARSLPFDSYFTAAALLSSGCAPASSIA